MGLAGGQGGLRRISLPVKDKEQASELIRCHCQTLQESRVLFKNEIAQIEEYFAGIERNFGFGWIFRARLRFRGGFMKSL